MPLDDREQKILEEIERQFYDNDPGFAEVVRSASLAGSWRRRLRLGLAGFVAGTAILILFFSRSTWLATVGFGVMVLCGWAVVNALTVRAGASETLARQSNPLSRGLSSLLHWRRRRNAR